MTDQPPAQAPESATPGGISATRPPHFRAFLRYFLGLGTWGFGGPIASVGPEVESQDPPLVIGNFTAAPVP